jgi:hypothetical protein
VYENHLEVRVEAWQTNRPRVMQVIALDEEGRRVGGVSVRLCADERGSFDNAAHCREIELTTAFDGIIAYRWVGWPAHEPHGDIVSRITARWERPDVGVYFEFFPEE